ncbi:MAG TPA: hypothetical protein PKD86_03780 [Gemmatales bacterium]|nr:hypothetical protein [Gemmatales bacterium]HMP58454.1 hypothetical protein [Gemmatales bacterium]
MTRKAMSRWLAGLSGLVALGLVGCQTHIGGMTLPSAYYLKQKPTYIAPAPDFPLPRELAQQQAAAAAAFSQSGGVAPTAP